MRRVIFLATALIAGCGSSDADPNNDTGSKNLACDAPESTVVVPDATFKTHTCFKYEAVAGSDMPDIEAICSTTPYKGALVDACPIKDQLGFCKYTVAMNQQTTTVNSYSYAEGGSTADIAKKVCEEDLKGAWTPAPAP
jgi:hypothetical protein